MSETVRVCEHGDTEYNGFHDSPAEFDLCVLLRESKAREAALVERLERAEGALEQIETWSQAYPLAVFPEPDWKRVHEVLKAAGLRLDQVSASNMRHVITKVAEIARTPPTAVAEPERCPHNNVLVDDEDADCGCRLIGPDAGPRGEGK